MQQTRVKETIIKNDTINFIDLDPKKSEILSKEICRILIEYQGKKNM